MPLGPIVSSPRLPEDIVVWPENGPIGSSPDRVHGARFQVQEDGSRDILGTGSLVVVYIDSFQLEVRGSSIVASWVNSVLVRDDLPKLKHKTTYSSS